MHGPNTSATTMRILINVYSMVNVFYKFFALEKTFLPRLSLFSNFAQVAKKKRAKLAGKFARKMLSIIWL